MDYWKTFSMLAVALALGACSSPDSGADTAVKATDAAPVLSAAGRVYIVSPENGATLSSPVTVVFGIEGYSVAPAGTYEPTTGHHHLLIDAGLPALNQPVPADDNHKHFGKAQTKTTIELAPGAHTLQLLLGDGNHVPHQTPLTSDVITITVSE